MCAGLLAVPLHFAAAPPAAAADATTISAPAAAAQGSEFYVDAGYSADPVPGGTTLQLVVTLEGAGAAGSLALPNAPQPPPEVTGCTSGQSPSGDPRMTCDWTVPDNSAASTALKVLATIDADAPLGTWTVVSVLEDAGFPMARLTESVQIVEADKVSVAAPATAAQGSSVNATVYLFAAALPGTGDQALPLAVSLVGAGANGSLEVPTSRPAGVTGCAVDTSPAGDPRLTCTDTVPVDTGGSATLTIPVGIGSAAPVGSTFMLRAALGRGCSPARRLSRSLRPPRRARRQRRAPSPPQYRAPCR